MIRPASFADIAAIVALLQDGHRRSHYAAGDAMIDEREAKRLLAQALQRHGSRNLGGTWVMVAEREGRITGIILGTLSRLFGIYDRLMASDLFWLVAEDADPRDAARLMRSLIGWAEGNPDCIEVKCGTQGVIGDPEAAGRILQRLGLKPYGGIYRREFAR